MSNGPGAHSLPLEIHLSAVWPPHVVPLYSRRARPSVPCLLFLRIERFQQLRPRRSLPPFPGRPRAWRQVDIRPGVHRTHRTPAALSGASCAETCNMFAICSYCQICLLLREGAPWTMGDQDPDGGQETVGLFGTVGHEIRIGWSSFFPFSHVQRPREISSPRHRLGHNHAPGSTGSTARAVGRLFGGGSGGGLADW